MTLLQDGLIAFLSAVGVTTLVWIVAGAFFRAGRPAVPGLLLVLPLAYFFSLTGNLNMVWWAFPVAEVLAGLLAAYYLWRAYHRVILPLRDQDFRF